MRNIGCEELDASGWTLVSLGTMNGCIPHLMAQGYTRVWEHVRPTSGPGVRCFECGQFSGAFMRLVS
jgi:hypothetical protein